MLHDCQCLTNVSAQKRMDDSLHDGVETVNETWTAVG